MRKGIQSFLKYTLSLAVGIFLFWYVFKDIDFSEMINRFKEADLTWVYLSIFLSVFSHLIRAYRWNLLLEPLGYNLKTSRTFLAVMVGYLANFIVPRMGEISRCGILQKTDGVPLSTGIGSVVTERIIDVLCLFVVVIITLSLEFEKLSGFFYNLISEKTEGLGVNSTIWLILIFMISIGFISYLLIKRNNAKLKSNTLFIKISHFLRQLVEGVLSIRKLKKGPQFLASTILMWILYYLMTYVVIFSLEETSHLTITAGFTMLVLGGIGMATPVQGGIGAFHYLMSAGLLLYGIPENDGIFFALLLHTTNSVAIMLVGLITFLISMVIPKRDSFTMNAEVKTSN